MKLRKILGWPFAIIAYIILLPTFSIAYITYRIGNFIAYIAFIIGNCNYPGFEEGND